MKKYIFPISIPLLLIVFSIYLYFSLTNNYFSTNDHLINLNLPIHYSWDVVKPKLIANCTVSNLVKDNHEVDIINDYFLSLLQSFDNTIYQAPKGGPITFPKSKDKTDYGRYAFKEINSECFFVWSGNALKKLGTIKYMNKNNNISTIKVYNAPVILYE
jgi:hypothetical protein